MRNIGRKTAMNIEKKLYQWDTEQKLTGCTGLYVDFPIGNEVYRVETADGTCIIPDELLQTSGSHKVYECMTNNTIRSFAFSVTPRPKPPDYVYTPTERLTFEGLVQRVDDAVADMIRRAESGEFDGHTPVKGTDYFTTAEIQQIQNEVSSGAIGEFKSVVDTETETFNTNAESKLTTYNENDVAKTGAYNTNASDKLDDYNTNASNKVTEYNSNAENKTAEFDTHTEQIQADISELKSEITQYRSLTNTANILKNPLFLDNNGWNISASGVIALTDTLANKVTITNSGTEQTIVQKIKLSELTSGTYFVSYKKIGGATLRIAIYTERDNSYYESYLVNVIDDHAEFVLDINAIQTADPLMTKLTIKFMLSSVGNSTISEPFLGIKNDYNGFWDKNFYNHENRLEALEQLEYASTLYGKKITFCGDSFTEGDFTGYVDSEGHSGTASDAYDSEEGMYKTFPYWIWKRTGCNKVMLAKSGYKLTNNATTSFTNSASVIYYQNIPIDSDIVVIQFGLNDLAYSDGTWNSSDATTWCGAFNEALNWITENIPKARILVIASDGDMTYAKRNLLNKMAVAWGCAFLDLKSLDVPLMLGGKYAEDLEAKGGWGLKDSAKSRANAKYRVTESNTHPNVLAHLHRSYIIQDALEKL